MTDFIEHHRLLSAQECVSRFVDGGSLLGVSQDDVRNKPLKEYRTVVRDAGVRIRTSGILQSMAFWLSKAADGKRTGEEQVLKDIVSWLRMPTSPSAQVLGTSLPSAEVGRLQPDTVLGPLMKLSSHELALVEMDAQHFVASLGRIAEGWWASLPQRTPSNAVGDSGT